MEIKIKHILMMVLIIIIGIFGFIVFRRKDIVSNEKSENISISNENETTYSEYLYYGPDSYTSWELGYEVAKKNGDWSRLPLTSEFRNKYNERDGILGNLEFDKIELVPYDNNTEYSDKYYFVNRNCYFVISRGKEKIAYIYNLKYDDKLLSDVLIKDICNLSNEYGEELNVSGYAITNNNFKDSMDFLARGGNDELSVAVTDHFRRKYPFFLDIFEHYSPLRFNHIEFVPEKSSWEKQEAYFIVDSVLECKKRYYKVKFTLDDKGYLDDVTVNKVNEEEYDGDGQERINKITYQNSNWDNLKLTDNFRSKYDNKIGIMDDIENINIDIDVDETTLEINRKYITCFASKNDEIVSYYFEYIKDKDGNLDNVVCEKLPYINKTASEVKELYLKDHSK